ncbi:response regulator transcription factor [Dyadobacter psychrotolerans]|uniref:Response regulator transcription factor n=1 Tax=Dyadobacter psychrotolerans TaxID=2541721 RepID=A0A4R5E0T7_9BACT|nr:response regulator transcription factor [Dyadobacter psychrotolerans]
MRTIAIDDEPIALDIISSLASKVDFISLEASYINAFEAFKYLENNQVDLIFLDIKMPDISGIDFYQRLKNKPLVIFTTAYTEHAVKSYELDAVDYLLKPFSQERFLKACNKVNDMLALRENAFQQKPDFIFLKSGYEQVKVFFTEIQFIESSGNYMIFTLTNRRVVPRLTMQETLLLLPEKDFIRIHRSFVVAKNKVSRIERQQLHVGTHVIPIGSVYAEALTGSFI